MIAVTGATGRLGTPLVEIITEQGHEVVAISRSKGVDVQIGDVFLSIDTPSLNVLPLQ